MATKEQIAELAAQNPELAALLAQIEEMDADVEEKMNLYQAVDTDLRNSQRVLNRLRERKFELVWDLRHPDQAVKHD